MFGRKGLNCEMLAAAISVEMWSTHLAAGGAIPGLVSGGLPVTRIKIVFFNLRDERYNH